MPQTPAPHEETLFYELCTHNAPGQFCHPSYSTAEFGSALRCEGGYDGPKLFVSMVMGTKTQKPWVHGQ